MTDHGREDFSSTATLESEGGLSVSEQSQAEDSDSVWKERILVVDDEERVCQTLEEFLTLRGYLVDVASGGPEAVRMLEEGVYALLLTDLMMPRMNGIELMEQARELDPDLMVVIITGFGTIETAVQALKQGAYDYVLKPFSLMEIERSVERALEKRRLAHENLQLAEINRRLREIDSLKSDLLGIVSHEFRTPLTSLKGYVSLLQTGGLGAVSETQMEALLAVGENTRRLEKLVDNILVLAEVGGGSVEIRMQDVDLGRVLEQAVQESGPEIASAGCRAEVSIERDLPVIRGDFEKLVMAVSNLIDNAVKFRSEDGVVHASVSAKSARGDGWIDLVIRDNGIGISEHDLNSIFDHFVQVDMSSTRRVGGVGLGLCVVKEIIDRHGGAVKIQSKLNEGTTVTVSLPTRTVA
jgi:two-component system sensor histidine kinase/response regulator